jgi:hypothetical protein
VEFILSEAGLGTVLSDKSIASGQKLKISIILKEKKL